MKKNNHVPLLKAWMKYRKSLTLLLSSYPFRRRNEHPIVKRVVCVKKICKNKRENVKLQ